MKRLLKKFLPHTAHELSTPAPPAAGLAEMALDQLPWATLVVDAGGAIVHASEVVTRLLGWSSADLAHTDAWRLFAAAEQEKLKALLCAPGSAPGAGQPLPDLETWVLRKNLQVKQARVAVAHFQWQGQRHACLSLRFSLIDDLKLRLAQEQTLEFKQASENKSRFLADLSHEIRTPLNAVLGMIDLLGSSDLDAQQQAYLSTLKKSSRNLRALIDDVLDFSKIEAGLVETERVPFRMDEILNTVVEAFAPLAQAKGVALRLAQTLEHTAYLGDPHRLSQVLNNLVGNALKFTRAGSVTVSVSQQTPLTEQDLCRLTIAVADTGIGIEPAQQAQLFDAFQQTSASVSRHYGGSGLGLSISKQLVELMGGEISMTSQPGKGSVFAFWVDLLPSESPFLYQETAPPAPLAPLAGARILVVDDDLVNRTLLEAWLEQTSAVVVCRTNGQEALDALFTGERFDAVLMDITMPVLDGLSATRRIRQPQAQQSAAQQRYLAALPIIGISGHAFNEDVARCLQAGMTACLTKPLSRAAMMQKLSAVLEPAA